MSGMESLLAGLTTDAAPDEGLVEQIKSVLHGVAHAPRAIERAAEVMLWHRAWQASGAKPKRGRPRGSNKGQAPDGQEENNSEQLVRNYLGSKRSPFDLAAAEALGCEPITIYRDRALAEKLGAEAIVRLWHSPIADNSQALKRVAAFGPTEQLSLFSMWDVEPSLAFSDAVGRLRLALARKSFARKFLSDFKRHGSVDRREALLIVGVPKEVVEDVIRKWTKRGTK